MSSTISGLDKLMKQAVQDLAAKQGADVNQIPDDAPVLIAFNQFLDAVIQNDGRVKDDPETAYSKTEILKSAQASINQSLGAQAALAQKFSDIVEEKKQTHIHGSKSEMPAMQDANLLAWFVKEFDELAAKKIKPAEGYENASQEEFQEEFAFRFQEVLKEVSQLPKDQRSRALVEQLKPVVKELTSKYGSERVKEFSGQVEDAQLTAFVYAKEEKLGISLAEIELTDQEKEIKEQIARGEHDLSSDAKKEVTSLVQKFFTMDMNDPQEKMSMTMEFAKLSPEQKAFYEHTREQAGEISNIASDPGELVSKLAGGVSKMLMPAVIGVVLSYIGGFGAIGGVAAIVLNALGTSNSDETEVQTAKKEPPAPNYASQAQAA